MLVQAYDKRGVVVGCHPVQTEQQAHSIFIDLCCSKDKVVEWVRIFIEGDPEPLVWAFRNMKPMNRLIMGRPPSDLLH
jgi:hypothetical protein